MLPLFNSLGKGMNLILSSLSPTTKKKKKYNISMIDKVGKEEVLLP